MSIHLAVVGAVPILFQQPPMSTSLCNSISRIHFTSSLLAALTIWIWNSTPAASSHAASNVSAWSLQQLYNIGVIGGGVSGVVTALELAKNGVETVLFEQKNSVVNGPPFCHLHAGGNLYPDISDEQCRILMKQSIEMARLFPQSIDKRPTFISIPKTQKYDVNKIQSRLEMLVEYYKTLIN